MNFKQSFKQLKAKIHGNARKRQGFACLATPDPTLPASLHDGWNSIVGSGLLDRLTPKSAGVKAKDKTIKEYRYTESQSQRQRQHRGKPPRHLSKKNGQVYRAGFSTPFPEGGTFQVHYFQPLESRR